MILKTERGRQSGLLNADDFTNGDLDDYSPSPSARSSPAPSARYKYSRFARVYSFTAPAAILVMHTDVGKGGNAQYAGVLPLLL